VEPRVTATVATQAPSRYLLQVAKHFRHKLDVEFDERRATIAFPYGRCELETGDGALLLAATGADAEGRDRVAQVVGSHLERFGHRDGLAVEWRADDAPPAATA
jgi:uncharacterized protein